MPKVSINIIKDWFKNQSKPPQEQFWAWLDSFWHKDEPIPQSAVERLPQTLQAKADLVNGVVPESQLPFTVKTSEILAIGAITATDSTVNVAVHSGGKNRVRIGGTVYERGFPNTFSYQPVVNYSKILFIYAMPEPALFYMAEGVEAPQALEPDVPPGAFVFQKILCNTIGQIIEPQVSSGLKNIEEDGWRNINLTDPLTVLPYSFDLRSAYWITGSVEGATIVGIRNALIDRNASPSWDGKEWWIYNATGGDLTLDSAAVTDDDVFLLVRPITLKPEQSCKVKLRRDALEVVGVMSSGELPDLSAYALNADLNTEIVNRALADNALQGQINTINNRTSSVVDKMLHYWDETAGKWLSSGLKFVSGVVNQLEFTGRIKADAIVLPNNTNPVVANRLRSDGNRLKYSDTFPIERDIAYLSDITGSRLIKQYVHTGNREIYPTAVNYATSRITATGHGFSHSGVKLVGLFLNGMAANYNGATTYPTPYQDTVLVNTMPFEWLTAETWIKVIDANTLEVCNSSGVAIAVDPTSTRNNGRLDFTKWHIEEFVPFSFSDIPPDYKNVEIRISGMCINRNYNSAGNRYIGIWSYLSDYTLTGSSYTYNHGIRPIVLPKITANTNINSVFFTLSVSLRTSNYRFTHQEGTEAQLYWSGALQQNTSQQLIRLSSGGENKGIAGLKSMTSTFTNDSTWLSNYSIIEIYAI